VKILAQGASDDFGRGENAFYYYVVNNIVYDMDKAKKCAFVIFYPILDDTLHTKTRHLF